MSTETTTENSPRPARSAFPRRDYSIIRVPRGFAVIVRPKPLPAHVRVIKSWLSVLLVVGAYSALVAPLFRGRAALALSTPVRFYFEHSFALGIAMVAAFLIPVLVISFKQRETLIEFEQRFFRTGFRFMGMERRRKFPMRLLTAMEPHSFGKQPANRNDTDASGGPPRPREGGIVFEIAQKNGPVYRTVANGMLYEDAVRLTEEIRVRYHDRFGRELPRAAK